MTGEQLPIDPSLDPALVEIAAPTPRLLATPGESVAVDLLHHRDHAFVPKAKKDPADKRRPPGCAECGAGKIRMVHVGTPQSLNDGGSGWNRHQFQGVKGEWQKMLTEALERSGLPRGLASVYAEGQCGFPKKRASRDQGNHRFILEKALGDALVEGGWLEDDDWTRYEFGTLRLPTDLGQSWTSVTLRGTLAAGV